MTGTNAHINGSKPSLFMPAKPKNQLVIESLSNGWFRLFGYALGKRVRLKSQDLGSLEVRKTELEKSIESTVSLTEGLRPVVTWLSKEQVKDAEAAFRCLLGRNHSLLDCVQAAKGVLGSGVPVLISDAIADYLHNLEATKNRSDRTVGTAKAILARFKKSLKAVMLAEISPLEIENFVEDQIGRARVVQSFLNYCVIKKQWIGVSPFKIDMAEMAEDAKGRREAIRVITPAQCAKLLEVAIEYENGLMLPYFILTTWCFLRSAEAQRVIGNHIDFGDENLVFVNREKIGNVRERQVTIPENMVGLLKECKRRAIIHREEPIPYSDAHFNNVRELAGLIERDAPGRSGRGFMEHRKIISGVWQENILRHTGFSLCYKRSGNIDDCCRQAGNTKAVAFAHYVKMARKSDADTFYSITGTLAKVEEPALMSA